MTSVAPRSRLRLTAPPHCNELSGLAESYLGLGSRDYCLFSRLDAVEVLGRADLLDRRHRTARTCHGQAADRRRARGHWHRRLSTPQPASRRRLCLRVARRPSTGAAGRRLRCGAPPRPDRDGGARQRRDQRVGARCPCGSACGRPADLRVSLGRPADAVPTGRDFGLQRLGPEPGRADSTADGPPARLDDLPHYRQPAARQGVGRTVAAAALRRPDSFPGVRGGNR